MIRGGEFKNRCVRANFLKNNTTEKKKNQLELQESSIRSEDFQKGKKTTKKGNGDKTDRRGGTLT